MYRGILIEMRFFQSFLKLRRFLKDSHGVASIEFAISFLPWFMLVAVIFNLTWQILHQALLDRGAIAAGEYLKSALRSGSGPISTKANQDEMRKKVCEAITSMLSCHPDLLTIALYPLTTAPAEIPTSVENHWEIRDMNSETLHIIILGYKWQNIMPILFIPSSGGQLHTTSPVVPFEIQAI